MQEEPRNLASWTAASRDGGPWIRNVEETLVTRDGVTNELTGLLATEWTQQSATTWRFNLREGVTFHDGTPFNAEAAAYALNYTWSAENNFTVLQFMGPQISAVAVSDYVLDVQTATPDPILPARLYFSPIFSTASIDAAEKEQILANYLTNPVGTGPYKFVAWNRGQSLQITLNESWWGFTAADVGKPTIRDATFTFNTQSIVRSLAVEAGDAELALYVEPGNCKPQCISSTALNSVFLRFDSTTNPLLSDVRIREAIALGVNTEQIVAQFMPAGTQAAQLVAQGASGFDPALTPYPHDVERAKQLVGQVAAEGKAIDAPLQVVARSGYVELGDQIIQVIQADLQAIGLTNVTVKVVENSVLSGQIREKPEPADRGMILLYAHGNPLLDLSGTAGTYFRCDGVLSTYCNPELDAIANRALNLEGAERDAAYQEVANIIYDNFVVLPIGYTSNNYAASDKLTWAARKDEMVLVKDMTLAN
jgi:peptide/nickel transport system substrate-binding protein